MICQFSLLVVFLNTMDTISKNGILTEPKLKLITNTSIKTNTNVAKEYLYELMKFKDLYFLKNRLIVERLILCD